MAARYPVTDRGDANDCIESRLVLVPSNALVSVFVEPKWVTQ
jgi:hypothetical protein